MNKQEALEAILQRVRLFEERRSEKPLTSAVEAVRRLRELGELVSRSGPTVKRNDLVEMAALCVHLLRDEWEEVAGRDLDAWLAANEEVVTMAVGVRVVRDLPPVELKVEGHDV